MAGWLSSSGAPSNVADAAAANLGPLNDDPGFFDNAIGATGEGLMKGGALAAQALMLAGSVVPRAADALLADDNFAGQSLTHQYFAALDDTITDAVEHWTPDARTTGAAGRVLSGIAEFGVPLMLSGGNPLAMAALTSAQATTATGADLARSGATAEQAGGVAAVQGAANLVGFGIATRGATALRRAGAGAAANLAVNVPADMASAEILAGSKLADRYDPANFEARAVDVVVGALFGAMSRGEPVRTRDMDAALTVNRVKHAQDDMAPGILETPAAARAQMDNMTETQRALIDGGDLPVPRPVEFKPDPVREADAARAVRSADEVIEELRADMLDAEVPVTPTGRLVELPMDIEADVAAPLAKFVDDYPDMPVALVDDPDVPEGVRRLTARDALDELQAETARDTELAKGYEAAINCFLRGA